MKKFPWRLVVAVLGAAGLLLGATVTYSPYRPTGPVVFQPGSVTVPQVTGTTGLFSGLYWPLANHLGVTISGHEAVRFHGTALTLHHTTALRFTHSEAQMHGGQRSHITALRISTVGAASSTDPDGNDPLVVGHASTVLRFETIGGELFRLHAGGLMAVANGSWTIGTSAGSRPNAIHVQTSIEARQFIARIHSTTIASEGTAAVNIERINPSRDYIELTCNDANGCTIVMVIGADADGGGLVAGTRVTFANAGSNTINFSDTAGRSELSAALAAAVDQTITLVYSGVKWREVGRSSN